MNLFDVYPLYNINIVKGDGCNRRTTFEAFSFLKTQNYEIIRRISFI